MAIQPLVLARAGRDAGWMSSVSPPVVLPSTDLARLVLSTVIESESPAIANHSVRSYLFARLLADELGATPGGDYDEELLFAARVLHDIGLSPSAAGPQRFDRDQRNASPRDRAGFSFGFRRRPGRELFVSLSLVP